TGFSPTISEKFYKDYCIPAYTFDKTNCGLIDAHQFARDPQALAVLNRATDAVLPFLPPKALNRAEMMARPHKNVSFPWDETDALAESLTKTHNSFETPCGAYGQFKITRYLMRVTGDSRYGDSMETILYNTILGARPIRPDGISFYYADYNHDAKKVDYEQK